MGSISSLAFIEANTATAREALAAGTVVETSHGHVKPSAPEHIEGVIFDLDGTLLDSMPWWDDLGERYLLARGKTPEPNIRYHFKRLTMEGSARYMKSTYHLDESIEEICTGVMAGIETAYRDTIPLKPGAADMLTALLSTHVPVCVATASERYCVDAAFARLGVSDYFKFVLTCSEVGASKTRPLVFERACELLGTPRANTLVVEDSLHAIETAQAAGFPCAMVEEPASVADAPAMEQLACMRLKNFLAFTHL